MEKEYCKILVVDDEKELRELLQELLRKEGYLSVEVASSCKEAEAKLSENCYQLILLDVMLTDGNGFDFYKKQKNHLEFRSHRRPYRAFGCICWR